MPDEEIRIDEDLQKSLKDIVTSCEREDYEVRRAQIREWKKHEEFWHLVQHLFWSERDERWMSPVDLRFGEETEIPEQMGSSYDYVVDIFKAHGESLISALASQIPGIRFLPDDADKTEDITTAQTYSKIAELICRHNKAKLIYYRALFFLYLNGVVASYRYKDSDAKYGVHTIPIYGSEQKTVTKFKCTQCGLESEQPQIPCPQCGNIEPLEQEDTIEEVPKIIGQESVPKTRVKIEIYGASFFKVPLYVTKLSEASYFLFYLDVGKDVAKYNNPDFIDEIDKETITDNDRFSRVENVYSLDPEVEQKNLVTIIKAWLRPAAFYRELDKDKRDRLLKKFPSGVRVELCGKNKVFLRCFGEAIDDRWNIAQWGLSTYIHADAGCKPIVQIAEMNNQLANLSIETIDHGIPSGFADGSVLNFDEYGKFEAVPGFMYKVNPKTPTSRIADSFYTSDRAQLSKEVFPFFEFLSQSGQFALGDFPSIFGGPAEGKTRTFSEYAASRQMALQRLTMVNANVTDWWMEMIHGAVKDFITTIVQDERFVQYQDGNYINVWIRQSQLKGQVGGVEPESSDSFPISAGQKKDIILKLIEMNNPFINEAIYAPENSRFIPELFGMTEFKIPGAEQRIKQSLEINELIKGEAIPLGIGPDGKQQYQSTVPIDEDVDDHAIHSETVRVFLIGQIGLSLLKENPAAYLNCIAHKRAHDAAIAAMMPSPGEINDTTTAGKDSGSPASSVSS